VGFADLTDLNKNRLRMRKVQRALMKWEAFERGEGPQPTGLSKSALESLRDTLADLMGELLLKERFPLSQSDLAARRN
jgi:hypothetical protein